MSLVHQLQAAAALLQFNGTQGLLVVECNEHYADLHGFTRKELAGRPLSRLDDAAEPDDEMPSPPALRFSGRARRTKQGGVTFLADVQRQQLHVPGGVFALEFVSDVTERAHREENLALCAREDVLTGLHNRRAFDDDIDRELARAKRHHFPLTVIMADLDGLKQVNDTLGHEAGDALLRVFAQSLRARFRKEDRLYRLGGDEFALLLGHSDTRHYAQALTKIRDAISDTRTVTGIEKADVSVGFSCYPREAATQGDLVRLADERMYGQKRAHQSAKRQGEERAAGRSEETIRSILQRTVRSTFAFLSGGHDLDQQGWESLLEAAVITVPGSRWGCLLVQEQRHFVVRAVLGYPAEFLGRRQCPEAALAWYGHEEHQWRQGYPRVRSITNELLRSFERDERNVDTTDLEQHPRASLCIPIIVEGRVMAHLNLEGSQAHEFSSESIQVAQAFAEQIAALLVSRVRRLREADRERELTAFAAFNVALGRARSSEDAESVLVDQAVRLLVTRYASFLRFDARADCLMSTITRGTFADEKRIVLPRGVGLSWGAVERRQVMHYADARTEAQGYQHEQVAVSLSTLYAPVITSEGEVLGVLAVGREASPFTDLDVKLVEAMVSAAANSLERTRSMGQA